MPPSSSFRPDLRTSKQLRKITFKKNIAPNALGSVLCTFGNTQVICAVSVENELPRWMKEEGVNGGWLTAEYSMLPYSTDRRKMRDSSRGKIDGRSQEIQRLIGRSLRAIVDLEKIGPRSLWVDCDVLRADGGTRTAAITGAYVALAMACHKLKQKKRIEHWPLKDSIAAISVGLWQNQPLLDLCYLEDKDATVDMNVVMTGKGQFVEIQGSGEEATFSPKQLNGMLQLARTGIQEITRLQQKALKQIL